MAVAFLIRGIGRAWRGSSEYVVQTKRSRTAFVERKTRTFPERIMAIREMIEQIATAWPGYRLMVGSVGIEFLG